MSRRGELRKSIRSLKELHAILGAMKNLSLIEIGKARKYLGFQRESVETMERAISDFVSFRPPVGTAKMNKTLYLLIGSERGFCGGFNDGIFKAFGLMRQSLGGELASVITVGSRLSEKFETTPYSRESFEGAEGVDEIPGIIEIVIETLAAKFVSEDGQYSPESVGLQLVIVFNEEINGSLTVQTERPFDRFTKSEVKRFEIAPCFNLSEDVLLLKLMDQYLLGLLERAFYTSILSEDRQRLFHMDRAVEHIEKRIQSLLHKGNQIRQEDITEEIEIVMLNVDNGTVQNEEFDERKLNILMTRTS